MNCLLALIAAARAGDTSALHTYLDAAPWGAQPWTHGRAWITDRAAHVASSVRIRTLWIDREPVARLRSGRVSLVDAVERAEHRSARARWRHHCAEAPARRAAFLDAIRGGSALFFRRGQQGGTLALGVERETHPEWSAEGISRSLMIAGPEEGGSIAIELSSGWIAFRGGSWVSWSACEQCGMGAP